MARRDLLESSPTPRERMFEVVDQADTPALSRHARTERHTAIDMMEVIRQLVAEGGR